MGNWIKTIIQFLLENPWVWIGVILYWIYCIFWGIKGFRRSRTASDYFIAGRQLPLWVFVLAATATSFSGWTFVGHPGTLFKSGLAYAFASFYAITIPFSGMLFLKRQWLVGKRYDFITPGEMFRYYYGSEAMRLLTVLVALVFSVPYLAVQLKACGLLFNRLTGLPIYGGAILLSVVVVFYVAAGGLRSVAWVDCLQCLLLIAGIVVVGISTVVAIGGWSAFTAGLKGLEAKFVEVPGIMKFKAAGPEWTGIKTLTYMFALMGIQAAPAFSMWAFSNKDTRPFPWQQVFASSLIVGVVLIFFTAFQGLGGQILYQAKAIELPTANGNPVSDALVPTLMRQTLPTPLLVFTAIAALAAMQSTGAAYMSTGGGMVTRDLFVRYIKPDASHTGQIWFGRLSVIFIAILAFAVAFISGAQLVLLGGLAVSYGFQMYPALIGALFWRRLTRQGIVAGLIAGLIAVSVTYMIQGFRYPLTIHSAGWGILFNLAIAVLVSYLGPQPKAEDLKRISEFHGYLHETASVPPEKQRLKRVMWILTPVWFIFAIGPGVVLGSDAGSFPIFGLPRLWVWQIVWWALGVVMMYMLAFKLEMSTPPRTTADEKTTEGELSQVED
jgi:SSS family transporter